MGIEWRESLSIGVEEVDNQHKELLRHFDRMLEACKAGRGAGELRELLRFLNNYVITHFTNEEAIQLLYKYPGYDAHKKEHDTFIARIKELEAEIGAQGIAIHNIIETNNLMLKWLLNHITVVDKELGKFLQKNAL